MFALVVRFALRDAEAAEAFEAQPHPRRFLDQREQYLRASRVEFLGAPSGKGV